MLRRDAITLLSTLPMACVIRPEPSFRSEGDPAGLSDEFPQFNDRVVLAECLRNCERIQQAERSAQVDRVRHVSGPVARAASLEETRQLCRRIGLLMENTVPNCPALFQACADACHRCAELYQHADRRPFDRAADVCRRYASNPGFLSGQLSGAKSTTPTSRS